MNHAPTKDYLAVTFISGGGSFARDADPDKAMSRCIKIAYSDWKHLFKLKGASSNVGLFDVTGHDEVHMDSGVVWRMEGEKRVYFKPLRQQEMAFPK